MNSTPSLPIVIISGPTGVGKSDFAEQLAHQISGEIINGDMGQLYTPLSIGTAKPDWQKSPIRHYLFDSIHEPRHFSVTEYRSHAFAVIKDVWRAGNIPIIVGGSSFYLQSLFFSPLAPACSEQQDIQPVWEELNKIDPLRAAVIHKNDTFRIKRALTIWQTTGRKPSEYNLLYSPLSNNFLFLFLTREREILYNRINDRVHAMMNQGWLEEVRALHTTQWNPFLKEKRIIGYDDLLEYLEGSQTEEALQKTLTRIAQRTRHYAKRQYTFWNMLQQKLRHNVSTTDSKSVVESINLTSVNVDLYIKHLLKRVM